MINKVNTNTMKKILILAVAVFITSLGSKAVAQSENCTILGSLFIEPAKAKNYEGAYPHYAKLVAECPTYSMATFQYGEKMFKHFIEKGDKGKVTELIQSYNDRLKYYPSKTKMGDVLSDIAQVKYDNSIGTKMEQYRAFEEAFKKDEENFTSPKALYTYFSLAVDLHDSGELPIQDVFDLYDIVTEKIEKEESKLAEKVTEYMDKQEAGSTLSSKEKKYMDAYERNLEAYGKVKGSVSGKLGILADCPNLIPLYKKDFEQKKNDVDWIKRAAGRLSAKDCDDPLFFQLVQQLHNLDPSAKSAYYLGKLAEKDGKSGKALEYFNQAAELETKPSDKARVYYSIAENFRKKGNYGQARSYYRKMVEVKPSAGIAYLKIANMYASSANNCGTNVFEKRAMYWLAADMADKAARLDASIAGNARQAASSYRGLAPSKSDIFNDGMAGKTVTFNCWVGGSVKVPNL
ncbi:TPR domain protein [Constantimarinum furrinae]|uniref:TPR domain protein n=2 Tax=Constantimarinum furrinae TaxID=2562285 RepID=A0A7G8PRZ2_9FLAO|nr:TPR domain protein [Constantimarinum furrinae]